MNSHYFGIGALTSDSFLTPPFNPNAPSHQPRGVPVDISGGVSKGLIAGEALVKAQPIYPVVAKQISASGEVQVSIVIGENGQVIEAKAIKGHPVLRAAAVDAAYKWVFKPTLLDGKPVKQPGTLTFVFMPPPPPTSDPPAAATGAETSEKLNVSGGVLQGNAIKRVQPPYPPIAKAARASGPVQVQITINEAGEVIETSVISGHPLLRDAALQAARQWLFKPTELSGVPVKVQGILTFNFTLDDEEPSQAPVSRSVASYTTKTEQLGKHIVEGVECEGTRVVATLPAGAIGNERPIETVKETWYSSELQLMILSKRSDPRFGESTYRVTNIARYEPDAEQFQIPSDYRIIDTRAKKVEVDVNEFEEMRRKLEETRKKAEGARKPKNQ
jgi:TonB family protein